MPGFFQIQEPGIAVCEIQRHLLINIDEKRFYEFKENERVRYYCGKEVRDHKNVKIEYQYNSSHRVKKA